VERRRIEVSLETESSLNHVKMELQSLRVEYDFVQRNRGDLEIALKATQEEKSLVERELNALRG